eukprot:6556872-Pyramimonas_sp.AAC.1
MEWDLPGMEWHRHRMGPDRDGLKFDGAWKALYIFGMGLIWEATSIAWDIVGMVQKSDATESG